MVAELIVHEFTRQTPVDLDALADGLRPLFGVHSFYLAARPGVVRVSALHWPITPDAVGREVALAPDDTIGHQREREYADLPASSRAAVRVLLGLLNVERQARGEPPVSSAQFRALLRAQPEE